MPLSPSVDLVVGHCTRPGARARAPTRSQSNPSGCESLALSPSYLNIGSRLDAGRPLMGTERSAPRRPTFDGRSRWHPEQTSVAPATFLPRRNWQAPACGIHSFAREYALVGPETRRERPLGPDRRDRETGNNRHWNGRVCTRELANGANRGL